MAWFARTRCHLFDNKEAHRALLRLLQVLFVHIVLVLDQMDCLGLRLLSLDYLFVVALLELHLHLALVRHILAEAGGMHVAAHSLRPMLLLRISRVTFPLTLFVALRRGERWRLVSHSNTVSFMLMWHRAVILPLLPISIAFVQVPLGTRRILRVLLSNCFLREI